MLTFGVVNRVFAAASPALAVAFATLTLSAFREDIYRATIFTALIAVVAALPWAFAAYGPEQSSGVRTPWGPAALMSALIAFTLSEA